MHLKIRIFALAKELGIDSKELIEFCNQAGVKAKNSALASISPEQRDTVVNFIESRGSGDQPAETQQPMAPLREESSETGGKVRKIEVTGRAQQGGRSSQVSASGTATVEPETDLEIPESELEIEETVEVAQEPETVEEAQTEEVEEVAAEAVSPEDAQKQEAVEQEESVVADVEAEVGSTAVEDETKTEPEAEKEEESVTAESVSQEAATEEENEVAAEAKPDQATEGQPEAADDDSSQTPHRQEDYIAPAGAGAGSIRDMEMKPRANVTDRQRKAKQQKKQAKPAVPFIAQAPEMAKPKTKKPKATKEPAAQKPDFKLTGDMLKGDGPLRSQLKRHIEEKTHEDNAGKGRGSDLKRRRDRERQAEEARDKGRPQQKRRRGRNMQDDSMRQRPGQGIKRRKRKGPIEYQNEAEVELPITVRSLSEAMGRPAKDLISILFKSGQMATMNDQLTEETALELALELGVDLEIKRGRDIEEELAAQLETEDDPSQLENRPPVITILGHVDHGKTTLLDTIRKANVAGGEAGGITQHIAAYQVEHEGKKLTFVDTPGHAAFGEMRARGANVTDIIVLVVAADDSVMPQTVECISHAKAAGVPIVVAMNKVDRPNANEQKVLTDLSTHEILPSEWGGEVEVVRTSALNGDGIEDLLETLLLTAELQEYKANAQAPATGICLEAFRDEGRGVLAWLMVKKGTLRIGDVVLCGPAYGRVRAIYNDRDEEISEAGPSTPVRIAGLDMIPGAGDQFFTMTDIEDARLAADERRHTGLTERLGNTGGPKSLDMLLTQAKEGKVQDLPLILKADTPGSLEALRHEINKFEHPEVRVEVVHEGVGGVNDSDVSLAGASGAIIIAFHVVADDHADQEADRQGVEIRRYDIIYEVTDHIKQALEGLLIPDRVQESTGRALVLQTFKISRFGTIAGCRVLNGTIDRNNRVNVIRDQKIINDYEIASLKREKDDTKEVREGMECGIRLAGFNDVKEGDLLEAFHVKEVKRKLE